MTILKDLKALLVEHEDLPASVNGKLLARDLRDLVIKYEHEQALQELVDQAQELKLGYEVES